MAEKTHRNRQEKEELKDSVTLRAFHLFIEKAKTIEGATEKTMVDLRNLFENQAAIQPEDALNLLIASRAILDEGQANDKDQGD